MKQTWRWYGPLGDIWTAAEIEKRNLAAADIRVVAYHTMPVLDWTRTDLKWKHGNTGLALRYDMIDMAAFDILILERKGARETYSDEISDLARERFAAMSDDDKALLTHNIIAGLPGAGKNGSLSEFSERLAVWGGISADQLRQNHVDFLAEIVPLAEEIGIRMACHPDDPPFAILGLPRIMSTQADSQAMFDAVDLPALVRAFGPRIHFAHLRNVRRESDDIPCSFHEDNHLEWLVKSAVCYQSIGRLRGLAELRGAMLAIQEFSP